MIKPYGSQHLNTLSVEDPARRSQLLQEAGEIPQIVVSSASAANAVMLGGGYFNPLRGYMNRGQALSIAREMRGPDGLFWPVPVLNLTPSIDSVGRADRIALRDPNLPGAPILAIQTVEGIEKLSDSQMEELTQGVFGTSDPGHPGVKDFNSQGRHVISGPLEVLNLSYFPAEFPETFRTAQQLREEMAELGWQKVVAFQTRNPMHRAHEELCRMACEAVNADGLLIHMLLGRVKPGDIPAGVRDASIRKMVDLYFPPQTVLVRGYGFDMLYAGPREAVLHAIFRQNTGCTHLIVGRDHAGVGSYYGPFDAQKIFQEEVPEGTLDIQIFEADHTAWSRKLNRVVMMRDCPDHTPEDYILLSGTKVRDMLSQGQQLPEEFSRPEVAAILMEYYQKS